MGPNMEFFLVRIFPHSYWIRRDTKRHEGSLRVQSERGKIRTRKNSVFGHFSRSDILSNPWFTKLHKHKMSKFWTGENWYEGISTFKMRYVAFIIGKKDWLQIVRSDFPEVFWKKAVLKYFANFKGKHLCRSTFLLKLQAAAFLQVSYYILF